MQQAQKSLVSLGTGNNIDDPVAYEIIEKVVVGGNLAQLNPKQRVEFYAKVCESVGLNPLTKPFDYITLNGKLTLYARAEASAQLRLNHKVTVQIVQREKMGDIFVVVARAKTPDGREDEATGIVSFVYPDQQKVKKGEQWVWEPHPKAGKPLGPEDAANAMMKAETKAKRRVTLSICGLGMPDESEVHDVQALEERPTSGADKAAGIQSAIDQKSEQAKPKPEPEKAATGAAPAQAEPARAQPSGYPEEEPCITVEQLDELRKIISEVHVEEALVCQLCRVPRLEMLPARKFDGAKERLLARKKKPEQTPAT